MGEKCQTALVIWAGLFNMHQFAFLVHAILTFISTSNSVTNV